MQLTRTNINEGQYIGILETNAKAPKVNLITGNNLSISCDVTPVKSGQFQVSATISLTEISQGASSFLLVNADGLTILDSFTISISHDDDLSIKEDLTLLRAELDMLKRAFRSESRKRTSDVA